MFQVHLFQVKFYQPHLITFRFGPTSRSANARLGGNGFSGSGLVFTDRLFTTLGYYLTALGPLSILILWLLCGYLLARAAF